MSLKVAVVGATGLVGSKIIEILSERNFPVSELIPVASEKSSGKKICFKSRDYEVVSVEKAVKSKPDLAIFSAGASVSKIHAPEFAETGCKVIDNSSCWRMDPDKKLIIPEINAGELDKNDYIIANPNCSTIQMLMPLAPLHKIFRIKRIVVSTYQSVTGSGYKAVNQLNEERSGKKWGEYPACYPYIIDKNVLPHIDVFLDNGYTKEEQKMVDETHKILRDDSIGISATTVRVPVTGGHSESVNVEFEHAVEIGEILKIWNATEGVTVMDDPGRNIYPMPLVSHEKDDVFVGRLRKDFSIKNGINFWCVADNIRKGAATNAVQIAEYLLSSNLL